jgi:hypothetical protein
MAGSIADTYEELFFGRLYEISKLGVCMDIMEANPIPTLSSPPLSSSKPDACTGDCGTAVGGDELAFWFGSPIPD